MIWKDNGSLVPDFRGKLIQKPFNWKELRLCRRVVRPKSFLPRVFALSELARLFYL
jgi:hypothetical protein